MDLVFEQVLQKEAAENAPVAPAPKSVFEIGWSGSITYLLRTGNEESEKHLN